MALEVAALWEVFVCTRPSVKGETGAIEPA